MRNVLPSANPGQDPPADPACRYDGQAANGSSLRLRGTRRITDTVRRHVGIKFNISLIRHLVATMLYEESPNAGPIVQRLLGHTQLKTSERMYGTRSTRSAHKVWAGMLEKQRRGVSRKTATSRAPAKSLKKKQSGKI